MAQEPMLVATSEMVAQAVRQLTSIAPNLQLRPEWIAQQACHLDAAGSTAAASQKLLQLFAACDLRDACKGTLPPNLDRSHNLRVEGVHVLQVLQTVDIANPIGFGGEEAFPGSAEDGEERGALGCLGNASVAVARAALLKVCLTDGAQTLCGIERKPVLSLRSVRPGNKIILANRPLLRRGLLLLEPQNIEVLGLTGAAASPPGTVPLQAWQMLSSPRTEPVAAGSLSVEVPSEPNRVCDMVNVGVCRNVPEPEQEVTLRFYVFKVSVDERHSSLWLGLCDGEGDCEAELAQPLLQALLGPGDLPTLADRAKMMHGFFELRYGGGTGRSLTVRSFSHSPSAEEVEEQLRSVCS